MLLNHFISNSNPSLFLSLWSQRAFYYFPLGALIIMLFMFIITAVQPYKEQFKAYSTIDAFMLLTIGSLCMIATAADEANTRTAQFSKLTYVLAACISSFDSSLLHDRIGHLLGLC